MNTGPRPLRLVQLTLALACLCAAAGCATRLKYSTGTRNEFTYTRTVFNGGTDGQGNPLFDDNPAGAMDLIVKPLMTRSGSVWLRVTTPTSTGGKTVYGDKNLGQEQILLSPRGKIVERKQSNNTYSRYDLFFDMPARRIRPGDSWTSQQLHEVHRTIAIQRTELGQGQFFPLDYEKSLPVQYKFIEKVRCGRGKCARLSVSASYEEVLRQESAPIYAVISYSRTGTVDFSVKRGMVHTATYDDVFYKQILDSYTGEVILEANDVNRYVYRLKEP